MYIVRTEFETLNNIQVTNLISQITEVIDFVSHTVT